MTNRREDDMSHIKLELSQSISQAGGFETRNIKLYALYGGVPVTEIPVGQSFEVHLEYEIINPNGGATWWSTSFTVWDVTHNKVPQGSVGYDNFGQHLGTSWKVAHDAINAVMEANNTSYRVKLWANQIANAGNPPTSEW